MIEEYKMLLPQWWNDVKNKDIILSNDVDGLTSCSLLNYVTDANIGYFYDFRGLYMTDELYEVYKNNPESKKWKEDRVWADVAIGNNEKTFDNHVVKSKEDDYQNKNSINPNLLNSVSCENYYEKYAGSTALMIWSLYNYDLPYLELGQLILLCIDTTFKGFYNAKYKKALKKYLVDMFGYDELWELLKKYPVDVFQELIKEYKLYSDIKINKEGYLETDMDIDTISELLDLPMSLPHCHFNKVKEFKTGQRTHLNPIRELIQHKSLYSWAYVGKNLLSYSCL